METWHSECDSYICVEDINTASKEATHDGAQRQDTPHDGHSLYRSGAPGHRLRLVYQGDDGEERSGARGGRHARAVRPGRDLPGGPVSALRRWYAYTVLLGLGADGREPGTPAPSAGACSVAEVSSQTKETSPWPSRRKT